LGVQDEDAAAGRFDAQREPVGENIFLLGCVIVHTGGKMFGIGENLFPEIL
jgi:hypothetical protein